MGMISPSDETDEKAVNAMTLPDTRFSQLDYPFYYIAQVRQKNTRAIGQILRKKRVSTNMWRVFVALNGMGESRISDITEQMVIQRTQLGKLLKEMETAGVIHRRVSDEDKRETWISFTEKGKRLFDEVVPIMRNYYNSICADLSKAEMDNLIAGLKSISRSLDRIL
jgi:DNA-binding MarR family transcriptional regulator